MGSNENNNAIAISTAFALVAFVGLHILLRLILSCQRKKTSLSEEEQRREDEERLLQKLSDQLTTTEEGISSREPTAEEGEEEKGSGYSSHNRPPTPSVYATSFITDEEVEAIQRTVRMEEDVRGWLREELYLYKDEETTAISPLSPRSRTLTPTQTQKIKILHEVLQVEETCRRT